MTGPTTTKPTPSAEAMKAAYTLNEDLFVLNSGSATADKIEDVLARSLDAFAAAAVEAEREALIECIYAAENNDNWRTIRDAIAFIQARGGAK